MHADQSNTECIDLETIFAANPITLRSLLNLYKLGYRYLVKINDVDYFKPYKTLKEARLVALNGRSERQAVREGACIERLDFMISFYLVGCSPFTEKTDVCTDEVLSLRDMHEATKIALRFYKNYLKHDKGAINAGKAQPYPGRSENDL